MRYDLIGRGLAVAVLMAVPFGNSALSFEPENPECIAPANPGGGWDFTCRQVGKSRHL
ncbi:MAG: hypothetical protein P8X61_13930 [Limibacillus sp.]